MGISLLFLLLIHNFSCESRFQLRHSLIKIHGCGSYPRRKSLTVKPSVLRAVMNKKDIDCR
jgi:hypothetical protein